MRLLPKLLCAILLAVVLGAAAAAYVIYREVATSLNNTSMEFARLAAVEVSSNLDLLINGLKHHTAMLIHNDAVHRLYASPQLPVPEHVQKEFERLAHFHPEAKRDAALFDPQGRMMLKTANLPSDINYSHNEYFAAALHGEFVVSRPIFSEQREKFFLFTAAPIVMREKILGVAISTMDLDPIASKVLAVRLGDNGYCYVLDGQGKVIVHPRLATDARVRLAGASGWVNYTWDSMDRQAFVSKLAAADWYVVASLSREDLNVQAARISNSSLAVNASLLAVIGLIMFFIVRGITASLARGVRFAKALSEGDFSHTLDVDARRSDELGELAAALRHMQHNLRANLTNLRLEKEKVEEARQELSRHK
jgi:methyl-accepting chemotaxis protein